MIFFSWIYEGQNKIRVQILVQKSFKIWGKWANINYKGDGYHSPLWLNLLSLGVIGHIKEEIDGDNGYYWQ